MSAMMSTIQNYLYHQDVRQKPRRNFIQENIKNVKLYEKDTKEKDLKEKPKGSNKKASESKKFINRGDGDKENDNILHYMHSKNNFHVPVTPETEVQTWQKSQGCQTLSDAREAYNDGIILMSRARPVTPTPLSGMKNICVQVDTEHKYEPGSLLKNSLGGSQANLPLREDGRIDYVRLNAIVPLRKKKEPPKVDHTKPPPSYQKGVVPKYLREVKKQHVEDVQKRGLVEVLDETENPEQVICLSEEEKKEHIKEMRKAYAKLVTELNLLPVRSDSMKTKKRREEIEQALQSIEDGIKMFSRNKLYVKAVTNT